MCQKKSLPVPLPEVISEGPIYTQAIISAGVSANFAILDKIGSQTCDTTFWSDSSSKDDYFGSKWLSKLHRKMVIYAIFKVTYLDEKSSNLAETLPKVAH